MFKRQTRAASHAKRQSGFTLIECMVATSVAGVLAAVGVPSMSSVMARQAVQAELGEFQGAVHRVRSEAIVRGEPVTICPMDPSSTAEQPACLGKSKDWSAGWIVFVDRGDRGSLDLDEDKVLNIHRASGRVGAITATITYLSFQSTGISANAASHFQFRPKGAVAEDAAPYGSRLLCVSKPGRLRVLDAANC